MSRNRTALIIGGLVVVVIVAAVLAVLLTGGDDDSGDSGDAAGDSGAEGGLEVYPVTITGDPLPPHEGNEAPDAAVGLSAPLVEGQDFWGEPASVGGPSDGPSVIYFLAHWCPACNAEVDEIVALYEAGEIPEGAEIMAVSTAVDPTRDNYPPSQWLDFKDWPYPVLADSAQSEAFIAYGGSSFPLSVILDADGNVVARQTGTTSAEEIVEWIASASA